MRGAIGFADVGLELSDPGYAPPGGVVADEARSE
jgi:hypothetical protein